jgi:hypothetical protein
MAKSKRTPASFLAGSRNTKPLSKAMYNWAKANMSKLKQPTKAQKKIFEKYKAMKAAGDTPANPKPRPKPAATTPSSKPASKPAQSKPTTKTTPKPAQSKPTTKPATGSGVQGKPRPVGSPGPNVTKPYGTLDRSGANVRRNLQDARRARTAASAEVRAAGGSRRRSTAAIDREVQRNEGGVRSAQRRKEQRQRRARRRGLQRNRRGMLARKYNKD